MIQSYVLSPAAANDLNRIWHYLKTERDEELAEQMEAFLLGKIERLAKLPHLGRKRIDLTSLPVWLYLVSPYPYFIVYLPNTTPLQVVSILHSRQDVAAFLSKRFT